MSSVCGVERRMGSDCAEWNLKRLAIQFEARRVWHYGVGFMVQCNFDGNFVRCGLMIPQMQAMMARDRFGMGIDTDGMGMERYCDRPDPSGSL